MLRPLLALHYGGTSNDRHHDVRLLGGSIHEFREQFLKDT